MDKNIKREIQNLRTKLNLYKKCISTIQFSIEHLKKEKYDYGEASENLLISIKDNIKNTNIRLSEIENKMEYIQYGK